LRISTGDWVSSVSCVSSASFNHAVSPRWFTNHSFVVRKNTVFTQIRLKFFLIYHLKNSGLPCDYRVFSAFFL
jgi:hypothetical protein